MSPLVTAKSTVYNHLEEFWKLDTNNPHLRTHKRGIQAVNLSHHKEKLTERCKEHTVVSQKKLFDTNLKP